LGANKLHAESKIASKAIVVILLVFLIVVIPYREYFGLFCIEHGDDFRQCVYYNRIITLPESIAIGFTGQLSCLALKAIGLRRIFHRIQVNNHFGHKWRAFLPLFCERESECGYHYLQNVDAGIFVRYPLVT
jgi:hypothetical protein